MAVASATSAELQELADLIRAEGIVRSGPDRSVVDHRGRITPWGLYTPGVSLTHRGMHLAGKALLAQLSTFHSTQLAAFGHTAMPLLSSCVLLGEGRYTGLSIRDKRKAYLLRQHIDGPVLAGGPVVVVDDSISAGTSLYRSIRILEAEGFEVEGAVALVVFPYREGAEWAYRCGYRIEAVFDIWRDLGMAEPEARERPRVDGRTPAGPAIEDGLSPAVAARRVAEVYLATGLVPRPPGRFDQDYDGRGGVFVSFRDRVTENRAARDGYWHFDPDLAEPGRDLVDATIRTVDSSSGKVSTERLPSLKVAVTFLGPLEQIIPAQLDFDRYGIVVRGELSKHKQGGALPNTQVFVSEIEQFNHAWKRNAGLRRTEPQQLFRHLVTKAVEPGEGWLPYGSPDGVEMAWTGDLSIGQLLINRVRKVVAAATGAAQDGQPLLNGLVPYPICGVAVCLYRSGLLGCGVAWGDSPLDALVCQAARRAVGLPGHEEEQRAGSTVVSSDRLDDSSIAVVILHDQELQEGPARLVAAKLRRGLDALLASEGDRQVLALPGAIPYNNLSRRDLVATVGANSGLTGRGTQWSTFRTTAWLGGEHGLFSLRFGFPQRHLDLDHAAFLELLASHIVAGLGPDGLPTYVLHPVNAKTSHFGTSARLVSGLVALDKAARLVGRDDWAAASRRGLLYCLDHLRRDPEAGGLALPGQRNGIMADCVLLDGVTAAGSTLANHPVIDSLSERVLTLFHPDGRICQKPVRLGVDQDHDYLPGAALLAATSASLAGRANISSETLGACLRWNRSRFRLLHPWGMAGWQPQGWASAWRLSGQNDMAEFAFEAADWAIERQLTKSGAFLEDMGYEEPSANTGFVAEGIAAAWRLAVDLGDAERQARYAQSWRQAMRFLNTLVVQRQDTFWMADPGRALGGVRSSISRSDIRIDAVSHTLNALVAGLAILRKLHRGECLGGGGGTNP